ncbi:MAG: adenylate/guanylate cyclase domain-containing protein [Defluviitaleaceae bacterium]|nr:adenylate/guanylate cyclase domain-containing protein [Defluviitaleaceae bacterium]
MRKRLTIILPAVLALLFALSLHFGTLAAADNIIRDNVLTGGRASADNIIIVGIDERSINEIGTWPWPRLFIAEAVRTVADMGAAAIGVNVLYDTPGAAPEYDDIFVAAALEADRLVLGAMGILSPFPGSGDMLDIEYYLLPFEELAQASSAGFLNVLTDESDGVMRRALTSMRYGDITVHSFPFEVYRTYRRSMGLPEASAPPLDANGMFPIRYVGGPRSFTAVSLWGVINDEYPAAMFRDAVVLIGPFAQGLGEGNFATPMDRNVAMSGIEIYANIVQNLMEGVFPVDAPWVVNLAVLILHGLALIWLFGQMKPPMAFAATAVLAVMLLLGVRIVYDRFDILLRVGDTLLFMFVCYAVYLVLSILAAQRERQQMKDMFGRFVAPEVVNEIISGGADIQLGGVVKEITALFVDIRGFTAFSENNSPENVVNIVNRYLGLTSSSIQNNSGTIDKFIGDATMALFNAPNNVQDHALCAVKAAWEMKTKSETLRQSILDEFGIDLQFGIGINSGAAVVGNMGSEFRMDYTAIGDAINTAARLEARAEKGQIIISDATYQKVKEYVDVQEIGVINVKNKKVGILVYSVENVRTCIQ